MTIDKEQLKALAEKSSPVDAWYKPGDLLYADDKTGEIHGLHHDDDEFIAAANPAAILALLGEIEHLTESRQEARELRNKMGDRLDAAEAELAELQDLRAYATQPLRERCAEHKRLKAENEALRKDAERYRAVRRVANRQGYSDEQFDQQTDDRTSRFDAAVAKDSTQCTSTT